ncbi:alpha-hydroxy-acid oxidizing protein [Streptomyces sp. NPDC093595]|uniref:alpha-hydroxy-acid oxidizing protein n=1 Tax=Streptomyces sp. NPDC093595 TaxID=3366045 RepID=UPI0038196898
MSELRIGIGVHSPITALLAEEAGADVLWLGSLEMSTSRGVPDREVLEPHEIAGIIRSVRAVTTLPIYVDADTGRGSDELAVLATKLYEEAGADAICVEDNLFPKRNSLDDRFGGRELMDPGVFAGRISAMVAARRSIQVIARTEALVAGHGPDAAVDRLRRYAAAGADALFAQANRASADQLLPVVEKVAPIRPMVLAPTVLPGTDAEAFAAHGPVTVLFANVVIRSLVAQTSRVLHELLASRRLDAVTSELASVERLFELAERSHVPQAEPAPSRPAPCRPETGHRPHTARRLPPAPEPPTGAVTGAVTEPPTGAVTGAVTEPPTGAVTDPLTEPVTGAEADRIRARALMTEAAFDYCAGGAGDEAGTRRNVERLDALTLTPRVLRDVSERSTATELFGQRLAAPLLVTPMGLQALCHPEAERATAAAATSLDLGFTLSMFGSRSVEEVADVAPDSLWQQVYLLRERAVSWSVVRRAEQAGARALVCTVDVPLVGRRTRDARNRFRRFDAAPPAIVRDPCFADLLEHRRRHTPSLTAEGLLAEVFPDPAVSWDDLAELRSRTRLPLVVKGILHPQDAVRAVDAGADAIQVSTHGGRQSDRHVAAVDALPGVVAAVGDRVPVLFDSGVRNGTHIASALALGARAVLVGRPVLWGLAAGGKDGVAGVLRSLVEELDHTMALLGASSVTDLGRELIDSREQA